ncbi:MAG: hemagglutinin repeat-containing protein [Actinobacillus porcinus]|nr:hemagglutinin repeat-containing protein [Actinobacillus porcinus]
MNAAQRLVNLGGKIQALDSVTLIGGQGVEIASQTSHSANTDSSGNAFAHTHIDCQADIHTGGKLTVYSPKDVTVKAANLSADIIHIQGNQVELGTVTTHNKQHYNGDADNYYRLDQTQEVGSQLTAKNDVNILSENHTALRQASVHSDKGTVAIGSVQGDIQIQEGRHQEQLSFGAKSTHHGTLQTITSVTKHDHHYDTAQGSAIDGNNILLQANNGNVSVQGSNVVAENHLVATAKNINIQAAENRVFEEDFEKTSKSGLMGSGGLGFSVGSKKEKVEQDRTQESAVSSQVGSLTGNTTLQADNHYQQTGSVVTAVNGDVDILAKSANITAAHSDYESNYKYTYEQKGLTIALSVPVLNMMNAVISTVNSAKNIGASKDDRINALAAANSGWAAYRLAQNAETIGNMASDLMKGNLGSDGAGGTSVGVSITYGQQKNVSTTHTEGNTAQSSEVNAGGKVNIVAAGAGKQSDINIIGSDVSGKQGTSLKADNDINLLAAKQAHQERSTNKSSGFNAGVAIQFGNSVSFGVTAGGNYGKGYGNGDESTYTYTHVGDANSQTTLESGATTNLKGAQVQGKGVKLDAQNLNIESLQETLTYKGKQMNANGQVTVGYGFSASGSYSQSKMNADYASVIEQSGIYTGDDGYQVNIQNHTDLKGGLITSSQTAEDNGNNRFETGTLSYSDIQNHADYSASGFGLGGGISMNVDLGLGDNATKQSNVQKVNENGEPIYQAEGIENTNGVGEKVLAEDWDSMAGNVSYGVGYDSEHSNSITKSGINTANIKIRDTDKQLEKTGKTAETSIANIKTDITTQSAVDNSGKLERNFDKDAVQKELDTQIKVTAEFKNNALDLINSFVDSKQAPLREKLQEALNRRDNAKTKEEYEQAKSDIDGIVGDIYAWQYGRRALQTFVTLASGSSDIALTQGGWYMGSTTLRYISLQNSLKSPIVVGKNGEKIGNVSYDSGAFDGVKLGGVRLDLDVICGIDNNRCRRGNEKANGIYKLNKDELGRVQFIGDSKYDSFNAVLNDEQNVGVVCGATGCIQGQKGKLFSNSYEPGSWKDLIIEAYAGSHDFIGGQLPFFYDSDGNTRRGKGAVASTGAEVTTILAIPLATPFAGAELLSPELFEFILSH